MMPPARKGRTGGDYFFGVFRVLARALRGARVTRGLAFLTEVVLAFFFARWVSLWRFLFLFSSRCRSRPRAMSAFLSPDWMPSYKIPEKSQVRL